MKTSNFYLLFLILFLPFAIQVANAGTLSIDQAKQHLSSSFPAAEIKKLTPTALSGVYEIIIEGTAYYMSEDGKYMFTGSMYDLQTNTNLTEQTYAELRQDIVQQINDDNTIQYAPDNYQYSVSVFTDVDCPYCQKFHSSMHEIETLGIRLNYIITPYRGPVAYQKAVNVWCAKDRKAAFDLALKGTDLEKADCKHPLENNLALAELAGVRGTPAFLLDNGKLLNGYRAPVELLEELRNAKNH